MCDRIKTISGKKMFDGFLIYAAIALFAYAFYKWATVNNDFFKKRNLKFIKPKFLVGNTGGFFLNMYTAPEYCDMLYQEFPNES